MKRKEFEAMRRGDIVRHKTGANVYVVDCNYGPAGVVIVRTQLINSPSEWDLIQKGATDGQNRES